MDRLDRSSAPVLLERLERLADETSPRWGHLDAAGMVAHLTQSLLVSLAETETRDRSRWLSRTVIRPMLLAGLLRIPPGRIRTDPAFLVHRPQSVAAERDRFREPLERFLQRSQQEPGRRAPHPGFGWMTLAEWQRLHWLHFDHHLRQFGV